MQAAELKMIGKVADCQALFWLAVSVLSGIHNLLFLVKCTPHHTKPNQTKPKQSIFILFGQFSDMAHTLTAIKIV